MSLLSLFLTLHPISPLSILSTLHLRPDSDYSLTLKGIAPFVDIWVSLSLARTICESLNVERLFWDEMDPTKGLLSKIMGEIQSWDEGLAIGHNWLPPSKQLPKSAYSLSTLLSTPLTGVDIIQDNRYITTPLDDGSRTRMAKDAETHNPSKIRDGKWHEVWDGIIALSDLAWNEFLLYPSIPPIPDKPSHIPLSHPIETDILHTILPLIPSLINHESPLPTYPFNLNDLQILVDSKPLPSIKPSLYSMVSSLVASRKETERMAKLEENEYKARLKICLAECLGGIMISTLLSQLHPHDETVSGRERGRRRSSDNGIYVFVEKPDHFDLTDIDLSPSRQQQHQQQQQQQQQLQKKDQGRKRDKVGSGSQNRDKHHHHQDPKDNWMKTIESLEERRGASPHPQDQLQKDPIHERRRSHSSRSTSQSDLQAHSPLHLKEDKRRFPKSTHHQSLHKTPLSPPTSQERKPGTISSEPESGSTATPPHYRVIESIDQFPLGDWSWTGSSKLMLSENKDGWQPYRILGIAILLGWVLGHWQVF
ncbi:hypothetical protein V865_007742 [Kwoniella europaea PYCC6329]|uniref:CCR4-NOT transcription complex subunit 11 n=1 Tax=Kwoniella europaea PYCC6329 TaxID=1423913 RepID=A0AAX4KU93_9TREE